MDHRGSSYVSIDDVTDDGDTSKICEENANGNESDFQRTNRGNLNGNGDVPRMSKDGPVIPEDVAAQRRHEAAPMVGSPELIRTMDDSSSSRKLADNIDANRKSVGEKRRGFASKSNAQSCPASAAEIEDVERKQVVNDDEDLMTTLLSKSNNDKPNVGNRISIPTQLTSPLLRFERHESRHSEQTSMSNEGPLVGHLSSPETTTFRLMQHPEVEDSVSVTGETVEGVDSVALPIRRHRKYGMLRSYSAAIDSIRGGSSTTQHRGGRRRTFGHLYPSTSGQRDEIVTKECRRFDGDVTGVEDTLVPVSSPASVSFQLDISPNRSRRWNMRDLDPISVGSPLSRRGGRKHDSITPPLFPALGHLSITDDTASTAGFLREQLSALFQVSDNRLAMKLFGSRNALQKEKQRQKATGIFVIHPCSSFRSVTYVLR